jgi:HTH-type transcriptional regulator/antitoxin HigA
MHLITVPKSGAEYDQLVSFLDRLIDEVGDDENHPLASLMDTVGALIEVYDNEHYPFSEGDPVNMIQYFMEINELTAGDLPEIGTPEVVTEILSGKRALHIHQIYALGKRFHVAPSTFL